MTLFHENILSLRQCIKHLVIPLMVCVSVPTLLYASEENLNTSLVEKKTHFHGYSEDVHGALSKKSPLLVDHDVIGAQIDNHTKGDLFLHKKTKEHYRAMWCLFLAQQQQFYTESGLNAFDTLVNQKSVKDLELLSRETLEGIKTKDVALPKVDEVLSLGEETFSLSSLEKEMLTDLRTLIEEKRSQNNQNPLACVEIKDLSKSAFFHTEETKKILSHAVSALLQKETWSTLHMLFRVYGLLDVIEKNVNHSVENSNAIIAGLKLILGKKEIFSKASNTKAEEKLHAESLETERASIFGLLQKRKNLQQEIRDKMIKFAHILKAPSEETKPLERDIYTLWPVDGVTAYGGYFDFLPNITTHGVVESVSVNVFGSRHPRSRDIETHINPLVDTAHVRQVFSSFQKEVLNKDKELEALLMGMDIQEKGEVMPFPLKKEEVNLPPVEPTLHVEVKDQAPLSSVPFKEVNVGDIAANAGKDIERILNSL